ncbi:MAG: efflux RND transporter permease subunit [Bdellovibrionales bacterium]|nr:efflux RND transporter permease subunit [Bdellovibrionales bacterium]
MSLSEISIRRPVLAWVLMFSLIFFGFLSFRQMGINENPDVDFPTVTIRYIYDGATPEVVEKDVIDPVEAVLVSMSGIRHMDSIAERNGGRISLEFELDRNIDFALQEVQTLLARAQSQLPDSVDNPSVSKANADDEPIIYLSLVAPKLSLRELNILFRDQIVDQFATIDGVAEVRGYGYHEPQLRVDLDAKKLSQFQLTSQDIVESIRREHKELPAGKLEYKDNEDVIRVMGEISDVDDFRNLIISRRGGSPSFVPIRLKDVANVYEGIENTRRISRINGRQAMNMAISKQRGVNAVATSDRVKEKISVIQKNLPDGIKLEVMFDRTQFIRESVSELIFTLLLSAFLTSLVCWIFLGSWSATANILLAIPTSIVGTFIVINQLGFTLNTFSLLGLALAIGVVVDDAIIVLENIVRYARMGFDRVNAAYKGSREITFAVVATSLAIIAIFTPIAFMKGIEGRFFFEFAVTISVAIALSSLESLTLAPMRCSQMLNIGERTTRFGKKFEQIMLSLQNFYAATLDKVLDHPWKVSLGSIFLVIGSLGLFRFLDMEFVPAQDRGVISISFQAPNGKSMSYTDERVRQFEDLALNHPSIDRVFVSVGGFGQGGQGNKGNAMVVLKERGARKQSQAEVIEELRTKSKSISGIRFFFRDRFGSNLGGRRGNGVEFSISGPDPSQQIQLYETLKAEFERLGFLQDIRSDDASGISEIQVIPNRAKATRSGVEIAEVAGVINSTFGGIAPASYTKGSQRFQIFVQLQQKDRQQIEQIQNLSVRNNRGEIIPLEQVVDLKPSMSPQFVYRENRIRGVRVDSSLPQGVKEGTAVNQIKEVAQKILPEGYSVRFSETPQKKLWDTIFIMVLGLVVAYMVLASQFNSFTDPWIVFLAIPFGLIGSLIALVLGGQSLNVYSLIGILLTMGIVKKNSILLVEFTNHQRDQGLDLKKALIEACPVRLRPILMTSIATVAAAVPAALALGPGAETRIPMALTVIGGVLFSTFCTLLVVPCVYLLFAPKRRKVLLES